MHAANAPATNTTTGVDGLSEGRGPWYEPVHRWPGVRWGAVMARRVPLAGAACLVTGASSGIGRAVARQLAAEGARVCLHGRDGTALAEIASSLGGVPWVAADIAEPGEPARVAANASAELGALDIVVNNAGIGWAGPFTEMSAADLTHLVAVDLTAPMLLTRELVGGMVARGRGHIVMIASVAGHVGVPGEAVYSATKAGLVTFADALRGEVAGHGVSVTVVSPGPVATAFFDRRGVPYGRRFPRPVSAEWVADAVIERLRTGRAEAFVPLWLTIPARLRGAMPGTYRRLAAPFTRRDVPT